MLASYEGFDSRVRALKSDITRKSYELFGEGELSWSAPSSVLTRLYFFSHFSRPKFQNPTFFEPLHSLLFYVSIQGKKTPKCDIAQGRYELFLVKAVALVGPFFNSDTSSLFPPFLLP
jgi:hypothetical protein